MKEMRFFFPRDLNYTERKRFGPEMGTWPHWVKEFIQSAKSLEIWSTSVDLASTLLSNSWEDSINQNYLKHWDENAVAGFGDMLTREITAFCNFGDDVLIFQYKNVIAVVAEGGNLTRQHASSHPATAFQLNASSSLSSWNLRKSCYLKVIVLLNPRRCSKFLNY